MVRKQAAESLTSLLTTVGGNSDIVDSVWLSSILPMINDREESVAQAASRLILVNFYKY